MFVETRVIELILSLLVVPPSLRYLERLWGSIETAKFIFVTVVASNVIAVGLSWIEYIVLGNAELFLFGMVYRGQSALQTGILVAFTQLIPEHQIQVFGVLKIRVKSLPMAYVTFSNIMCIIGYQAPFILIQFGWLVSWVWLRFYKRTVLEGSLGGVTTHGDRSETFAFVSWFPPFAQYVPISIHFATSEAPPLLFYTSKPVSILSNFVYNNAVRFKLVHPSGSSGPEGNDLEMGNGGYAPLPGGARAEAERRRAMALKALDQRMAAASSSQPAPQPASSPQNPAPKGHASSASRNLSVTAIPADAKAGGSEENTTR
ncbi:hypothetical protein FRC10_004180 [Ceratobasidium sp. 414]|nr:hypothetical protein FRC10_004180 [Ceratobasidium sp. 414]